MEKSKELLLMHSATEKLSLTERVNIMLTPRHYTLKKEEIPVKYRYQAKRIAPSLFEGLLKEERKYDYLVFKEEEQWVFIAYDIAEISDFLLSKGIRPEQVSKLFFAQQAREAFDAPVFLGSRDALTVIDGTVVVVPRVLLGEEMAPKPFNSSFMPDSGGVSLDGAYGSLLSRKQAITLSVLFMLFAVLFFAEGMRYGGGAQAASKQLEALKEEEPSLRSERVRKSIAQKYRKIDTEERKKREVVRSLSKMIFKGVTLTGFHLDGTRFKAEFSCSNAKVAGRLKQLAAREKFSASQTAESSNKVTIEGQQ